MQGFVGELGKAIEVAFDSEEYRSRIEAIEKEYKQREGQALQSLGKMASDQDVALLRTPQGFAFAPMKDGEPMTPEQVEALSDEERERIGHLIERMREPMLQLMHDLPRMRREMQTRMREASRDTMGYAAGHLIDELKEQFAAHPTVLAFLDEVLKDVLEAGQQLREQRNEDGRADRLHRQPLAGALPGEPAGRATSPPTTRRCSPATTRPTPTWWDGWTTSRTWARC